MFIPVNNNDYTPYVRVCEHCKEEMKEVGLPCPKCRLVIHEICVDKCKR